MHVRNLILPILLVLAANSSLEAQAAIKIGYIDSQAILQQDPAAQEAQQQLNAID